MDDYQLPIVQTTQKGGIFLSCVLRQVFVAGEGENATFKAAVARFSSRRYAPNVQLYSAVRRIYAARQLPEQL